MQPRNQKEIVTGKELEKILKLGLKQVFESLVPFENLVSTSWKVNSRTAITAILIKDT